MSVCRHKTINKWQLKIVLDSRMQCGADPFQREPSQKMRGEPSRTPPSSHLGGERNRNKEGEKFGCSQLERGRQEGE